MVWYQANKFNVPRIAFINKLDRVGASLDQTLEDIIAKLNIVPLVLQIPIGESDRFRGVVDLVELEVLIYFFYVK